MISKRVLFFSLYAVSLLKADTYTLYLASTPDLDNAINIYNKTKNLVQNENLIIRTHEKGDFSIVIRYLKNREEAIKLKNSLSSKNLFKGTYFKKFKEEPFYNVVNPENKEKIANNPNIVSKAVVETSPLQETLEPTKSVKKEFVKDEPFFNNSVRSTRKKSYSHKIESSNVYLTAVTMYNLGNYSESYGLFKKLFLANNYNVNVNYFLAQSAIRLKKFDEASAALERVLIQKPNFNKARYDYAKVLYLLKLKNEAKKEFETLLNANINNQTKSKIRQYIKSIDNEPKYGSINANILIGVNHSSNVNKASDEIFGNLTGEKSKSDFGHNEIVDISFINGLGDSSFKMKNSLLGYNQNYFDLNDENFSVFGYKPALLFFNSSGQDIYSLNLGINRVIRKNDESFNSFSVSPEYVNRYFLTSLTYQKNSYLENKNKDGSQNSDYDKYEFLFKYNLLENLKIYTKLQKYLGRTNADYLVDRMAYENGFEYFYKINNKNMLKLDYDFVLSNYKNDNVTAGSLNLDSKRKDREHSLKLSYIYKYNNLNQFIISSGYTKNDSNQSVLYSYDEFENKISYIKTFTW